MGFALLHKFNHWSEVLSVLTYCSEGEDSEFLHYKGGEVYTDPLGKSFVTFSKGHFNCETPLIINGSIHLETHPLSKGKIPYSYFPCKVAIEHTTGYSPWDFLQMIDLAKISSTRSEDAQGSTVLYLINKKCYDRFMSVDWDSCHKEYYSKYKPVINELVEKGYVVPTYIEPAQFWLENVPSSSSLVPSDNLCLCLNWCNLNKVVKVKKVVEICEKLHSATGKNIDIRLHSYSRESLFHILESLPYVNLITYESMSKYDLMDKYQTYFVDGTGLGYEIAYRNKYKGRSVDIFYLSGLSSDDPLQGFDGIVEMGAVPDYDYNDFLKGQAHSNFSDKIIKESFPHSSLNIPKEVHQIISNAAELCKSLMKEG